MRRFNVTQTQMGYPSARREVGALSCSRHLLGRRVLRKSTQLVSMQGCLAFDFEDGGSTLVISFSLSSVCLEMSQHERAE